MDVLSLRCRHSPRREAPRTLRERLECSEGGNTGRRTGKVLPCPMRLRAKGTAVRSAPGRGRAESKGYRHSAPKRKRISAPESGPPSPLTAANSRYLSPHFQG